MDNYDYMFPREFIAPAPKTDGISILSGMNPMNVVPGDYFDPVYDMARTRYGIGGFANSGFNDPTDYAGGQQLGAVQDAMAALSVAEWLFGR